MTSLSQLGATSTGVTSSTATSASTLSANYELFLSLQTTQIQNQDPLDPMDSSQYTEQLVQYSSVEQAIKQNENLEKIIAEITAGQQSSYVSYLGAEVSASGDTAILANGAAEWKVSVTEDVSGTVEIRNEDGETVYTGQVALGADDSVYEWDGKMNGGEAAPAGTYSASFVVANGDGKTRSVSTDITGIVDEIDVTGSEPILKIGNLEVPVSAVTSVRQAT